MYILSNLHSILFKLYLTSPEEKFLINILLMKMSVMTLNLITDTIN